MFLAGLVCDVLSMHTRLLYMERKDCSFDSLPFNVARSLEGRYAREKFLIQVIIASYEPSQRQLTYKKVSPVKTINFNAAAGVRTQSSKVE